MIQEPDLEVFKKLAAGRAFRVCEGKLEAFMHAQPLIDHVKQMVATHPHWIIAVRPTAKQGETWWLHFCMAFFRDGLSTVNLSDGRFAVCTWAAHTGG